MEVYSEKQRVKLRSMSEPLILKSQEISNSIEHAKNEINSIQKFIDKKSIELKEILVGIDSINMISNEASSYELLNREKYQNLFNFVQHKYLRKIAGIY
jgi:hypothetical protein